MALKRSSKQLVDEASARITTISVEEAKGNFGHPGVLFVDIRDVRELDREGMIPGAFRAPRGVLEFRVDPVCHIDGGFTAWKKSGGPVAPRPSSKPKA